MTTTWKKPERLKVLEDRLESLGGFSGALANRVVSVRIIESQYDAFELARRCAQVPDSPRWHLSTEDFPEEAKKSLIDNSRSNTLFNSYTVMIAYPEIGGQSGGGGSNVSIIVLPYWGDPDGKIVEISVGCKHEMHTTKLGNCYYKYTCSLCGFNYSVDSGD
jgi:hypothetical protein